MKMLFYQTHERDLYFVYLWSFENLTALVFLSPILHRGFEMINLIDGNLHTFRNSVDKILHSLVRGLFCTIMNGKSHTA